jgi:uncharacterized membrane protein
MKRLGTVTNLVSSVLTVIIGVILSLVLISILSTTPGHDEMFQRQTVIENQLRYVSCLLLIPPDERVPEAVAECQVTPDP